MFFEDALTTEAIVGAGEKACRQKQEADRLLPMRGELRELLPEALLELLEIGCLSSKGGVMDLAHNGGPLDVMLREVAVDPLVGIEVKGLADELLGQALGVRELGRRSAPSERPESSIRRR